VGYEVPSNDSTRRQSLPGDRWYRYYSHRWVSHVVFTIGLLFKLERGRFSLDEATVTGISNEFSTPLDGLPHATQVAVADALNADSGESTSRGYYSPDPRTDFVVTGPEAHYSRIETTDHDGTQTTGYEYSVLHKAA